MAEQDTSLNELSLSISRGSPVPLHHQLRHMLQDQIERGTLRPGQQIPHERQYAEHLGISLAPVRQALLELVRQGYLLRVRGKGTFVRDDKVIEKINLLGRFPDLTAQYFTKVPLYATLERLYGVQMGRALSTIEVVQIAGDEANLLQLAPGASALRVQGTTFDQDDRATEVSRVLYRADRFRFSLESHRVGGELRHVIGPASDAPPFPPAPATAGQARRK